jgi:hypothetical protein
MNSRGAVLLALAALLFGVGGYWLGRKVRSSGGMATNVVSHASAKVDQPALPPVRPSARPERTEAERNPKPQSIEELAARLSSLSESDRRHRKYWEEWHSTLRTLSPAELVTLLAAVEKNPSVQLRHGMRAELLSRLAESDPVTAMAYAEKLPNKRIREQAIASVFQGWGQTDPDGALAWAKQLPAGQFKNSLMGSAAWFLSQENPQAAFDLYKELKQGMRNFVVCTACSSPGRTAIPQAPSRKLPSSIP